MSINQRSAKNLNGTVRRERDSRFWRRCLCCVLIGTVIVAGFALAVQQHFAAHQYSVQNVELHRERERLKTEQKRLLLERETVASLDRLKQRAEKIGLQELEVNQINSLDHSIKQNSTAEKVKKD